MEIFWAETMGGWGRLGRAVMPQVEAAAARLALEGLPLEGPFLRVHLGRPGGLYHLDERGLWLSSALVGPELHHPEDQELLGGPNEGLALDRWRRATGAVLEGAALWALAHRRGVAPEAVAEDPFAVGLAADAVDRAEPALGWLWPELVGLLNTPEVALARRPRRAAWWVRYRRREGQDIGPPPTARAWADFGAWLRDRADGPLLSAPVPVETAWADRLEDFHSLPALSHALIMVRGGHAGSRPTSRPGQACAPAGVVANRRETLVLGAIEDGPVPQDTEPAGPVGVWALRSGEVAGRVGAARGVSLELRDDGALELILADAFLGPPTHDALEMADKLGVSGSAGGWWQLVELAHDGLSGAIRIGGLDLRGMTVHPREPGGLMLPAAAWMASAQAALRGMMGVPLPWRYEPDEGHMVLQADQAGLPVELRLVRE